MSFRMKRDLVQLIQLQSKLVGSIYYICVYVHVLDKYTDCRNDVVNPVTGAFNLIVAAVCFARTKESLVGLARRSNVV